MPQEKTPTDGWTRRHATHLQSRAGFGGTPEEINELQALGREQAVERLLRYEETPDSFPAPPWVREPWVDTEARLPGLSREEAAKRHASTRLRYRQEVEGLKLWWLERLVKTRRPLQEKLVLFWHWHFPTGHGKVFISQAHWTQNELFRKHATGNFRELAQAVTVDPAMMLYLDSHANHREEPNENYARELMELFTLGIGQYTEADVKEAARALSGWSLEGLTPHLVPAAHDDGMKTVLGRTGAFGTREVVDLCVEHPATAPRLAAKLLEFFGVADPHGMAATRLAATLRTAGYELKPVLRELFLLPEFYSAESMGTQIKCPVQLLVGTLRLLPVEWTPTRPFAQALARMGQELFNPPNVKGWLKGRDLITTSTLMARYQAAEMVVGGRLPGGFAPAPPERQRVIRPDEAQSRTPAVSALIGQADSEAAQAQRVETRVDERRLFPDGPPPANEASRHLCERLLVAPPSAPLQRAVAEAYEAALTEQRVAVALRLIVNSPEYQVA